MNQLNETPMRPKYKIHDKEILKLVKEIFVVVDQAWVDTQAHGVAELINNFMNREEKKDEV